MKFQSLIAKIRHHIIVGEDHQVFSFVSIAHSKDTTEWAQRNWKLFLMANKFQSLIAKIRRKKT